jgi:hypothetical protein
MARSMRSARDLLAVRGHGDRATIAHAAAVIGEIDDERGLAFRRRLLRREGLSG